MPAEGSAGLLRRPGENRSHGVEQQVVDAQPPIKAGTEIGEVAGERMHKAGIELEIAGILRRGAVDDARPVRGDEPVGGLVVGSFDDEVAHGFGVLGKAYDLFGHGLGVGTTKRFEIGDEIVPARHIELCLFVVTAVHGVVGSLEEARLDVDAELYAVVLDPPRPGVPAI